MNEQSVGASADPKVGQESDAREIANLEPGEIVVSVQPEGLLLGGDSEAVSGYLDRIREVANTPAHVMGVDEATLGNFTGLMAGVTSVLGQSGKFVQLHPDSVKAIRDHHLIPGSTPDYFRMLTRGSDGKFVQQLQWRPTNANPARLMSAQMIAVQLALKAAVSQVEDAVKRVEGKVDEVLRIAQAHRAGDVLGDSASITRMVEYVEKHGSLADADWDAIASVGPALTRTVEQLRQHATRTLQSYDPNLAIRERAALVQRAVTDDHLGETLSLLVVAQDSLFKWQRLRISRVANTQPQHLQKILDDARELVARQFAEDGALFKRAKEALEAVAETKTTDGLWFWAVDGLDRALPALRRDLDAFAAARRTQAGDWKEFYAPEFLEATSAALDVATETAARALNAAKPGITRFGNFVSRQAREAKSQIRQRRDSRADLPDEE